MKASDACCAKRKTHVAVDTPVVSPVMRVRCSPRPIVCPAAQTPRHLPGAVGRAAAILLSWVLK